MNPSGNVQFVYVVGDILPEEIDASTIYVVGTEKKSIYIGSNFIVSDLTAEFETLRTYIENYLGSEDFIDDIEEALQEMVTSGALSELLAPVVEEALPGLVAEELPDVVTEELPSVVASQIDQSVASQISTPVSNWLTEHVDPQSQVVIDDSLTIQGAAADAKAAGDGISQLKSALSYNADAFNDDNLITLLTENFYLDSDGVRHNSGSWEGKVFELRGENYVRSLSVATNTVGYLACAFYSASEISANTLISGVAFTKTGEEAFNWITVPSNAVICVITNRTATKATYTYQFSNIPNLTDYMEELKSIDIKSAEFTRFLRGYVTSGGAFTYHQKWNSFLFNCENLKALTKVKAQSDTSSINSISFYSDEALTTYISGIHFHNISGLTVNTELMVEVPNTAKYCVITSYGFTIVEIEGELKPQYNDIKQLSDTEDGNTRVIFKNVLFHNDFAVVHDELWGGQIVSTELGTTTMNIYKLDKEKKGITYFRSIDTDFNHLNTFNYNPANDCLLLSNSGNDAETEGNWFAVVKNPRGLGDSATLEDDAIVYEVNVGYKVNAFWGDSNLGENNIVYLVSNGIGKVTKLMLGKTNGEFDGTFTVLDSYDTGESGFIGGGCYWDDKLYIGNGTSMGYRILNLTTHDFESVETVYYDGTSPLNGSNQGIIVDAHYLWKMINKGGTTYNWILQYNR